MPLPAGVTTFTLTGTETDATGAAANVGARGSLTPVDANGTPIRIVHLASGQEIVPVEVTFTVGTDGTWSVGPLPYTDQSGLSAVGFQYRVAWNVPARRGSPGDKTFSVPSGTTSPVPYSSLAPSAVASTVLVPAVQSVSSVNGHVGAVTLAAADVGLGNVNNTSDANKPVSTATQTALNAKAVIADVGTSGTATGDALKAAYDPFGAAAGLALIFGA